MGMPHALLFGVGILLRAIINTLWAQNEKLAGALSGFWDGIISYTAWRTDRLLEPLVLFEIIAGVCFDALFHGSPTRLVALALGTALGVLLSDTVGLHTLWDDVDEKLRSLDVKVDLDAQDLLSEISDDRTVIYEDYAARPRNRKMTTAEWIAAQQKARSSSKASSRRASASIMNISTDLDKSVLISGFDTQTQITTQTESTRARKDRELLGSMTPLPVPSIARTTDINIDVEAPSTVSRVSSPTVRTAIHSVRGANGEPRESVGKGSVVNDRASSVHTTRRKSPSVKPQSIHPAGDQPAHAPSLHAFTAASAAANPHPRQSLLSTYSASKRSTSRTPKGDQASTDRGSFSPFIPPRPEVSKPPTVFSSQNSDANVVPDRAPSVAPPSTAGRARMVQSRASTRRMEHVEPSIGRTNGRRSIARSKISSHQPASPTKSALQTEISNHTYSQRGASPPPPEVVIDYSGETTRIYIPPPAETGINVRIVPHAEDDQHHASYEPSNISRLSERPQSQPRSNAGSGPFAPQSLGSFPDLDTVPPDEELSTSHAPRSQRSRASQSRAELSSDPQPPSVFKLRTAWRDSFPPASSSPSTVYGGRVVPSDDNDPLPIFVPETLGVPTEFHRSRSRSNSVAHSASRPRSILRKSCSGSSLRSTSHQDSNILELDMRSDVPIDAVTPSIEFFGPRKASHWPRSRASTHSAANNNNDEHREESIRAPLSTHTHRSVRAPSRSVKEAARSRSSLGHVRSPAPHSYDLLDASKSRSRSHPRSRSHDESVQDYFKSSHSRAKSLATNSVRAEAHRTGTGKIDVHRLGLFGALRAIDNALTALQNQQERRRGRSGGSAARLTIVYGSPDNPNDTTVLKHAIVDRVTRTHKCDVKIDDSDYLIHVLLRSDGKD